MRSCSTSPARRARRAGGAPSADRRGLGIPPRTGRGGGRRRRRAAAGGGRGRRPADRPTDRPERPAAPGTGPFTFIAPRRLSCEPLTRARVRLLGPCFKTGRVGSRHRRRPRALRFASPPPPRVGAGRGARGLPRTETPRARRRDDARGALGTVRPAPGPPHGERGAGAGERSRRGRGGPAPPEGRRRRAPAGGAPSRGTPAGVERRRGGERGDGSSGSLGPGIRRALLPGGCNTRGRRIPPRPGGPPRATFPEPGLPSRPGAGRGAPPTVEMRPAAAGRRPGGGPPPTPPPAPPDRPPRARRSAGAPPPERGGRRRRRRRRGERERTGGGVGRNGERERSAGNRRHGRTRRRVESSGRTARTPPVYLLTVSRPLELSLQSSFQLSLTVLVDYRSRAGI